jgi:hypothetical protein
LPESSQGQQSESKSKLDYHRFPRTHQILY